MKKVLKNKRGITLIALVITIIVLLILAGVSIATLTGDNGLLKKVDEAKKKTMEEESIERIRLEVLASYGLDGKLDIEKLNENLLNINGVTYNGKALSGSNKITNLPITVRLNGNDINIDNTGKVEKVPGIVAKIIANPTEYYGKKVINYKANENDTNTYRIFYVDRDNYFKDGVNTIYLKADDRSEDVYELKTYASYDSANTMVRTMNPQWAKGKKDGDTKTRGESEFENVNAETKIVKWNINEQAAAYLCSPVNEKNYEDTSLPWKKYYNSKKANYVIGGPSVEMYIKSYNEAYDGKINDDTKYPLVADYRAKKVPGYNIYLLTPGNGVADCIDYKNYNSMYCGKDGSKTGNWWLASPSTTDIGDVCVVYGENASFNYGYYQHSRLGLSPIVSLKSSFIPEVGE